MNKLANWEKKRNRSTIIEENTNLMKVLQAKNKVACQSALKKVQRMDKYTLDNVVCH